MVFHDASEGSPTNAFSQSMKFMYKDVFYSVECYSKGCAQFCSLKSSLLIL